MRALIQRVSEATVRVDDAVIGEIGPGLLILICAMQNDTEPVGEKLAAKISKLRIFTDEAGKMNRSLADVDGQALVVSQFTLAADTSRGNRPGSLRVQSACFGDQDRNGSVRRKYESEPGE